MLHLALDMHTAPRRLARQKTVGPAIQPGRSVLAGCGLAIPFVRMYLRTDMAALIEDLQILHWRDPQDLPGILSKVTCSVHVDDVSQLSVGQLEDLVVHVVHAAERFVTMARRLKLVISEKSVIVASSKHLSSLIKSELAALGVGVKLAIGARDLGIHMPGLQRRRLGVLGGMLTKASGTLTRITRLAKENRRATKLIKGAALPQAMWGIESLGLSPTQLDILCTQTAGASGCTVAGRCVPTAIAFSNVTHPAIFVVRRMMISYFQLLPLYTAHINRFRAAWAEAWKQYCV